MKSIEIKRVRAGQPIKASAHNRLIDAVRELLSMSFDSLFFKDGTKGQAGRTITLNIPILRQYIYPWDKVEFGYKINQGASTVTIYSGHVFTPVDAYEIGETTVTVNGGTAASPHYAYVKADLFDINNSVVAGTALASFPTGTQRYFQKALFGFSKVNGVIAMEKVCNTGSIVLPVRIG